MISIVCWCWGGTHLGDRPYQPAHVNALRKAVARHLPLPHRFVCVADSTDGFDPEVEVHLTPREAREIGALRSPEGQRFPSCYRRLYNFSDGARAFGERLLCTDVDWVPTGDLSPLFARTEDFVGWRPLKTWGQPHKLRFGGGVYLLTPGTRTAVWSTFRGLPSIAEARAAGFRGSDQAWLSYRLARTEPYYGREAGIYSIRDLNNGRSPLPADARMVHFNGHVKPWTSPLVWVREHWPGDIHAAQKGFQPQNRVIQHTSRNQGRTPKKQAIAISLDVARKAARKAGKRPARLARKK